MEEGQAVLDYALGDDAGPSKLRPELLLATLLRKLGQESAVSRTVADNFGADVAQSGYTLTLAVPSYFSPAQCAASASNARSPISHHPRSSNASPVQPAARRATLSSVMRPARSR